MRALKEIKSVKERRPFDAVGLVFSGGAAAVLCSVKLATGEAVPVAVRASSGLVVLVGNSTALKSSFPKNQEYTHARGWRFSKQFQTRYGFNRVAGDIEEN